MFHQRRRDVFETIFMHDKFPRIISMDEKGAAHASSKSAAIRFRPGAVVYGRSPSGGAAVLSPRLEISDFEELGVLVSVGKTDNFGSGLWNVAGTDLFFTILGRDSFRYDVAPNVFASFVFIEDGYRVEAGSFQIDLLGCPCIVNRFSGELPGGVCLDDTNVFEASGRDSWEIDANEKILHLRLPASEFLKIKDNRLFTPGERLRIRLPLKTRGCPVVLSSKEENARKIGKNSLSDMIAYAARR